jgi:DNA helicase-2/ATP-dependent DNA helicase PcrA
MTRRAQRIVGEVQKEVRLPWSGTFHSVANRLIRRHCRRLGLDESFSVLDRGDAADLIDLVRHERGLSKAEKRFPRKDTCLAIYSHRVNTQRPLKETLQTMFRGAPSGKTPFPACSRITSRRSWRRTRSTTTTFSSTGMP